MAKLTKELEAERIKISKIAKEAGLDFFDTIFELVKYDHMSELAAYGGFPVRYPHWRFGMEYNKLSTSYKYGLSKIYEMVINTDPCYAYLMEGNTLMDQKLVMTHVFGHCDFFKNNVWFKSTNRKMIQTMSDHARRIKKYMDRYGKDKVESFIDVALSLDNLIDVYNLEENPKEKTSSIPSLEVPLLRVDRQYMDKYINPPEYVAQQKEKIMADAMSKMKFPVESQRDVLKFLIDYAPLEEWQSDVLSIIRSEALYFAPQGMTKTINEGWASYWHSKLMTEQILADSEIIEFADKHAGVMQMAPNGYNPYKIGIELLRDIEERWNKGQFGKEWEECDSIQEKANWDKKTMLGREKIFEVRKFYNDVNFIDEFLTLDFCKKHGLYVYKQNPDTGEFEVDTTNFKAIKQTLLFKLTNFGQPIIKVENANFDNKGELLLVHSHEGVDMQPDYMERTMKNLFIVWSRPVLLQTIMEGEPFIFRYDGKEFSEKHVK